MKAKFGNNGKKLNYIILITVNFVLMTCIFLTPKAVQSQFDYSYAPFYAIGPQSSNNYNWYNPWQFNILNLWQWPYLDYVWNLSNPHIFEFYSPWVDNSYDNLYDPEFYSPWIDHSYDNLYGPKFMPSFGWVNPYQTIYNPLSVTNFSTYVPGWGLWPPSPIKAIL